MAIKKVTKTTPVKTKIVKETKKTTMVSKPAEIKEAIHINKDLKISPRKFRLLVNDVKKMNPFTALERLPFVNTNGARFLIRDIKNAIANAKNNYHLNPDTLKFKEITVDEGTKIKRMDKAHGYRFSRGVIIKRHSRLTIILSGEELTNK
jgi:large subunit ribosomal protein L22